MQEMKIKVDQSKIEKEDEALEETDLVEVGKGKDAEGASGCLVLDIPVNYQE